MHCGNAFWLLWRLAVAAGGVLVLDSQQQPQPQQLVELRTQAGLPHNGVHVMRTSSCVVKLLLPVHQLCAAPCC